MKKYYIKPEIEAIIFEKLLQQIPSDSVGIKGGVTGESDTKWDFGGDAEENLNLTPTAKSGNLWDAWDD